MGFWDTLLGKSESTTTSNPIIGAGAQNQFFQALMGGGMNTNGWPALQGLPGYQGALSPDQNANLTTAFGRWSPTNQGTDYMSQMLGQYGMGQYGTLQNNMQQYGGLGGWPTELMHNMAQYGGTGGAGNYGMSNLMQYGAAGPAGQGLNTMSQFGTSGTWGDQLQQMARGGGAASMPLQSLMQGGQGMAAFNPLQQLASGQGNASTAGLQQMIAGGGNPINQLPAWQAMVGAQQNNIAEGQARLAEQFNSSGNRFSTAFGTAAKDYQNQAVADQNALLGQMVANAGEGAQNRLLNAAGTFGGYGANAGAALAGYGAQGAGQYGSQTFGAGQMLAGLGANATNQLSANSILGTQGLYGTENQAALGMYGGQLSTLPQFMNYNLGQQQLGQSGAQGLNSMLMGNLGVGAQLGQQQYNNQQSAINNQYTNWWNSLPQNNPLLPYMYGAATGYNQNTTSNQQGGLLSGLAGLGGAAIAKWSDIRLKEDITPIGKAGPLNIYSYRYKGLPEKQLGFMAQEVYPHFPEAVIVGDDTNPWMIKPGVLLEALARSAS